MSRSVFYNKQWFTPIIPIIFYQRIQSQIQPNSCKVAIFYKIRPQNPIMGQFFYLHKLNIPHQPQYNNKKSQLNQLKSFQHNPRNSKKPWLSKPKWIKQFTKRHSNNNNLHSRNVARRGNLTLFENILLVMFWTTLLAIICFSLILSFIIHICLNWLLSWI